MRVAVEEPVPEDHRHPRLGDQVREPAALVERPVLDVDVGELHAVEVLERQHARARVRPVDLRHGDVRVPGEVVVERVGVARLEPVVELLPDRARELVDELVRVDEVERADALLREPRGLVHQREVGLDLARRVRPLHLDGDALAVRQRRAMHLADRCRRQRLLVELGEQALDRLAELLANRPLDVRERERAHVVLQAAQLGDDVGRHDVGPRREQLAELDERRAELVEHLAQVPAARRSLDGRVLRSAAVDRIAEAVPDRDLGDLAQATEVALLRTRRHRVKCARRGGVLGNAGDRRLPGALGRFDRDGRRASCRAARSRAATSARRFPPRRPRSPRP